MLSQGWEVKSLGIAGEGSIRENFLFVRLGNFVEDKTMFPPHVQYPAELTRGNTDHGTALDTTGLPSLTLDALPLDVVWQPVLSSSSSEGLFLPEKGTTEKKKNDVPDEDRQRILELKAEGKNKTEACREVYNGNTGGKAWYNVSAVWAEGNHN